MNSIQLSLHGGNSITSFLEVLHEADLRTQSEIMKSISNRCQFDVAQHRFDAFDVKSTSIRFRFYYITFLTGNIELLFSAVTSAARQALPLSACGSH